MSESLFISTPLFWIISILVLILLCWTTYVEALALTIVCLLAYFILLAIFGDFNLFVKIINHPSETALFLMGYVIVGIIWSMFKWYIFVLKHRNKYIEYKKLLPPDNPFPTNAQLIYENIIYKPQVTEFKSVIIGWMTFWPISLIITILGDFVKDLFEIIYNKLKDIWQRISDYVWKDVK